MNTDDVSVRLIESMNATYGVHPGHRAAHAKGVLCAATFTSTGEAATLSRASHLTGAPVRAHVRFSNGSGDPHAPDAARDGRGMAVKLYLPDGSTSDIVALSLPAFFARNPEDLLAFNDARRADPKTGQPDLAKVGAYLADHPEAMTAVNAAITHPIPASYASLTYHSIHAYRFDAADGSVRHGRYHLVPDAEERALTDEEAASRTPDYLRDELTARLEDAPAVFHINVEVAAPDDLVDDPTAVWPSGRAIVELGRLDITGLAFDRDHDGDVLVFDPTRVTDGIQVTDDPILLRSPGRVQRVRRTAYELLSPVLYGIALSVAACLRAGTKVDVAWIVESDDFPDRDPTDALAITPGGGRVGSLLGGAVTELPVGRGRLLDVDVSDVDALVAGLPHGGTARCLVVPATDLPAQLWDLLLARKPVGLVSHLDGDNIVAHGGPDHRRPRRNVRERRPRRHRPGPDTEGHHRRERADGRRHQRRRRPARLADADDERRVDGDRPHRRIGSARQGRRRRARPRARRAGARRWRSTARPATSARSGRNACGRSAPTGWHTVASPISTASTPPPGSTSERTRHQRSPSRSSPRRSRSRQAERCRVHWILMTQQSDDALEVLRAVWAAQDESGSDLDEDCSPTKNCKNMRDITFDGYAEPGSDLTGAWREKLAREGKLSTSGGSIRDLVLGPPESR